MKISVLTGGVGGAKFLLGVKAFLGWDPTGAGSADHQVTAVVNTGDDIRLHGLQVCPDLDSCMYTLSGVADTERGWGRKDETWTAAAELASYGAEAPWFSLGDKDIATHLVRTRMLDAGYPLSAVTAALAAKWEPGVTLLPMSDQRVETHVVVSDPTASDPDPDDVALHFQEWWTRYRAAIPAKSFLFVGAAEARPADGVLEAIAAADLVLIAPSNPVVSIGPILDIPGIRQALFDAEAPVVGCLAVDRREAAARSRRRLPHRHRRRGQRAGRRPALRRAVGGRPARRVPRRRGREREHPGCARRRGTAAHDGPGDHRGDGLGVPGSGRPGRSPARGWLMLGSAG